MNYKTSNSIISKMASRIRYLIIVSFALMGCNALLALLLFHEAGQRDIVIVPTDISKTAEIKTNTVSASYLEQTALFFVNQRLNVTPKNVEGSDQDILRFVNPRYYNSFKQQLASDSAVIVKDGVSSVFYSNQVKSNPSNLSVEITGSLNRWVGDRSLGDEQKTYVLRFSLSGSELLLNSFQELPGGSHV